MTHFKLPFPHEEIGQWARAYDYPETDQRPIEIGDAARSDGFLKRADFLIIARWKSRRPVKLHEQNDEETVREITRFALATPCEPLRLKGLTLLSGVADRTASAILHFCHRDRYPLMDERALGSLGVLEVPKDWSAVWPEYTGACREMAATAGVDMRTLDRALWAYSKANGLVARSPTGRK